GKTKGVTSGLIAFPRL
uniref:Periviscerokinin-3 n=1 Tax=Mantis religiosa TaxID=7507 RepID=PVK3_MANRE|nr:RecName: Full=Periviscerokinin-3; Short=Manre-PVK-3 [Mantis religiosa]